MIKYTPPTKAVRDAGKAININIKTVNKLWGQLKVNRFKIPRYAQPNRSPQL